MSNISASPITRGASVGWIGLGSMGIPMAKRLADAGYLMKGYNRTKNERVSTLSFPLCSSPAEAADGAGLVILMLRDGLSSRAVLSGETGLLSSLKPGQILVNMSTESPEDAQWEASECQKKGVAYFDIPVSGSVVPAARGELLLLAGGAESLRSLVAEPMALLGKSLHWFGPAGSGMAAKLAINFLLAVHMESLSETFLLGEALGIDRGALAQALLESPLTTPFYRIKIPTLLAEDYRKAFSASLMKKDLDLLLSALLSRNRDIPEPLSHARSLFQRIVAKGEGEKDLSVIHDLLKKDTEGS